MSDALGDRIKRYEAAYNHKLTPRSPVIIRVDGRAFHTYTKGLQTPFDQKLMDAMVYAAQRTAEEMQGFKLGYVQSDEVSFLITDYDALDTQGWFGYELNKLVSLSASAFTAHFNHLTTTPCYFSPLPCEVAVNRLGMFDSRAFSVPVEDVPNVFIWRQRDWERNSLQMLARTCFSHRQLQNKGRREIHDMLHEIGVNWAALTPREKNGTFILRDKSLVHDKADYEMIRQWIEV
ncbi:tRNA nucleotidyltransferase [Mycobacterium phage Yeet]|nr:tRNA nucleotidyltransferase [Mycobacterium phage Yeet]